MQFVGIEIAPGGTHGVVLDLDSARVIAEASVAGCKEFAFCGSPLKEPLDRTGLPVVAFLAFVASTK